MHAGDIAPRFWSKVKLCAHGSDCSECCWLWQAATVRGYGNFFMPKAIRQGHTKLMRAPRVCWWLTHGEWPGDLHVLHTCDNPLCVQPAHLWLGSIDDNQKDSMRKGRRPTGEAHGLRLHPEATRKGAANSNTKLTPDLVYRIRTLIQAGNKDTAITRMLPIKINRNTIRFIRLRRIWKHLPED